MTMNEISGIQLLFTQLKWPSVLVRERATTELARLLLGHHYAEPVTKGLYKWISEQMFESLAANGLLVFIRAQMLDPSYIHPPLERILEALNKPSLLSYILLQELFPDTDIPLNTNLWHLNDASDSFRPSFFFEKYATSFLPPIYYKHWVPFIEEQTKMPFKRQCALEWNHLVEETQTPLSRDPLDFWLRRREGNFQYLSVDMRMSEIYRSAFLRTLAWLYEKPSGDQKDMFFLAAQACPIDLELWQLPTQPKPQWWPHITEEVKEIDTILSDTWQQVNALWDHQRSILNGETDGEWILAEASGTVHQSSLFYDLKVCGVFQKCHGPTMPQLNNLVDWYCDYDPDERNQLSLSCDSSLHFSGWLRTSDGSGIAVVFDDWSVAPAAGIAHVNGTTPRWQFWRMYRHIWLPSPFLAQKRVSFGYHEDAISALVDEHAFAKWNDWTYALGEKLLDDVPPFTGQHLLINRNVIRDFAAETESTFCWICELTCYYRQDSYEEFKSFKDYRSFGASLVVRP